jgi:hypothetical protein
VIQLATNAALHYYLIHHCSDYYPKKSKKKMSVNVTRSYHSCHSGGRYHRMQDKRLARLLYDGHLLVLCILPYQLR